MHDDICIFGMGVCIGIPIGILMLQTYAEIIIRKRRKHPDKGLNLDLSDNAD